jgi:DNA-directed RNA polymerase specialized sigma24 family protein
VRRLVGPDDGEGQDMSQMAVIELVRTIGGFRGECELDTWVSAVTAHVVFRYLRRRPGKRLVSLNLVPEQLLSASGPHAEGNLASRQVLARVLGHLDAIGEKLSWGFVLHDVLGHNLRDAARIMGVSESAAQSRLVRGRGRLHQRIAEDPELVDLFDSFAARARDEPEDLTGKGPAGLAPAGPARRIR